MFNMTNVGIRISELRKAKNMTQMELADKMGISFQAVSNWERGNSMPDISKLPELAQLFGVTVDEILGEKSDLLDSAVENRIDEYLTDNPVTPQQLGEVATILKPEQVDGIVEKVPLGDLNEVIELLPFINRSLIDEFARKMTEEGKSIVNIAPFVSRELVAELAAVVYKKGGIGAVREIAPFLSQSALQDLAKNQYAVGGIHSVVEIAPFLDRSFLGELARETIRKEGINAIGGVAPFLDRDMLSDYVRNVYL